MLGGMQEWPLRLSRLIDHAAREHGRREIVSYDGAGARSATDWAGLAADSKRLARVLERIGMRPGDRIATLAMNHARQLVAWFGTMGMGGVIHTLNFRLFDDQLVYVINHAGDRVLFYDESFATVVARIRPQLTHVEHVFCFETDFDALIAGEPADYAWAEGDERDAAMLCYTSGTTGHPKGVLYEHRTILLHMLMVVQPDVAALARRSVVMPVVPLFHAGAWGLPFAAACVGAKLVLCMQPDPAIVHRRIIEEGVTHCGGVPTVWLGVLQHVERHGGDLGKLELVMTGGTAAPRAIVGRLHELGIRVCHLWGMTEISPVATVGACPPGWDELDAEAQIDHVVRQGQPAFGIELRIVDAAGREVPADGESSGSLQVRGAWVIERYFRTEASALDADGWFDTGDVAVIHPDGVMQITDRAKDVIKSGGEWISSIDLENAAVGCAGVAEAAAVAVAHPKWDERPLLLVVRKPGSEVDATAIRAHLSGHVAKWWLPDEILFVDDLPHTGTGKLLKTALREQYRNYRLKSVV